MIDRERVREIVAANADDLLRYLLRRVSSKDDAADLLGEVLLVVWRRIRDLPRDEEGARMWMFGIARRVLLAHERGRRRRVDLADRLRLELRESARFDEDADLRADVLAALAELPAPQREVVLLVHGDGFSLAEAATLMHASPSTTRGRYATALARLRRSEFARAMVAASD